MSEWMSDPMTWSVPLGRYFGIRVKLHLLFLLLLAPYLVSALIQEGIREFWWTTGWSVVLFCSVLLHEFGHCFAARAVGGDAEEILMWPLGGLATVSAPNTARAQFITTVWGPTVNVIICVASATVLLISRYLPPLNPLDPFGGPLFMRANRDWLTWTGVAFAVNWILLLFNLIPAFPMDGGRIMRCLLWNRMGFGKATLYTVQVAKVCAILMGVMGFVQMLGDSKKPHGLMLMAIAFFVYRVSERERLLLESGMLFDESLFGYEYSTDYSSYENSPPRPKARRLSAWERWRRRRERAKRERELARRQEDERRVDEILAKLHQQGMASLTDQERRFLTQASEKYRSRNRST